jgi:hypothetical protein
MTFQRFVWMISGGSFGAADIAPGLAPLMRIFDGAVNFVHVKVPLHQYLLLIPVHCLSGRPVSADWKAHKAIPSHQCVFLKPRTAAFRAGRCRNILALSLCFDRFPDPKGSLAQVCQHQPA